MSNIYGSAFKHVKMSRYNKICWDQLKLMFSSHVDYSITLLSLQWYYTASDKGGQFFNIF